MHRDCMRDPVEQNKYNVVGPLFEVEVQGIS